MNWRKEAENDLRTYLLKKQSVESIEERIRALKMQQTGIQAVRVDPTPGGSSQLEDSQANIICEIKRLKLTRAANQKLIEITERGLSVLDDRERLTLEKFYIDRPQDYLGQLMEELHVEKSMVYKIKEEALKKFTAATYGIPEF